MYRLVRYRDWNFSSTAEAVVGALLLATVVAGFVYLL